MTLRFRLPLQPNFRRALMLLASPALLLAGCRHEGVVVPAYDTDYFPVVVGTYRTYAVVDSSWADARLTVSAYQFREVVQAQFTDAAGQPAYRVVRARRLTAAEAWRDDSVLVVQVLPQAVLLTRNNVRTVELVYPARAGKAWNATAYTVNAASPADTITDLSRAYGPAVGQSYTTPAAGGQPAKTYDATVLTKSVLPPTGTDDVNVLYQRGTRQVYARGVGLVLRRRFSYYTFTINPVNGIQTPTPGVVQRGASRRETLIETGKI